MGDKSMDEKKENGGTTLSRLTAFLKGGKGTKIMVALGVTGMALILLSNFWPSEPADKTDADKTSVQEYIAQTEQKLTALVSSIEGAGECSVMVTLENGVQYVYATQDKINTDRVEDTNGDSNKVSQRDDTEKSIIVVDTEDGRQGLLVTEIQPTVKGVVVVCQGGEREDVRQRILEAVTTALNISSKRVCVTKSG